MAMIEEKTNNPMSEYLLKLQLIVSNTEFMNKEESDKYETMETRMNGEAYVNAILKKDEFDSYDWSDVALKRAFNELHYPDDLIRKYIFHPEYIPTNVKNALTEKARAVRIETYKEQNKYHINLTGKPLEGVDPDIPIPDDFFAIYAKEGSIHKDQLVHTLPAKYMELFMNSKYYKEMLQQYPHVEYLRHMGTYSIPIEISRRARDGDILLINESKLHTHHETFGNVSVSPEIVHEFTSVYKKTQRYIYGTLRGDFSYIYPNYNSLIRYLSIYMTIGQCMNQFMHKSTKLIYMNNQIANDYFSLYGLPSVLMEMNSLTKFLKKFRLLLMDKGTNTVYRVKDLIGYEYTDIYTLVMVKQQVFENGYPIYYKDPETGKSVPKQNIVFRRMGTADDNASYFQFKNETKSYTVEEITSGDPRWWNTPEVERMINDMNYTLSNSKYIQLSTMMSMDDIWWQTCILLRGLLDHKNETKYTEIEISQSVNGTSTISVFDAVLLLIIMMTWSHTDFKNNHFDGNLHIPNGMFNNVATCVDMLFNGLEADGTPKELKPGLPYKVASFNFNIKNESIKKYNALSTYAYLVPDIFMPMLDTILERESANIGEVLMHDVKLLYDYLGTKLRTASTIHEFRQVTDAYNWLFLVDPLRDWSDDTQQNVETLLMQSYELKSYEWYAFKHLFLGNESSNASIPFFYNDATSPTQIPVYRLLNENVLQVDPAFSNPDYMNQFITTVGKWKSELIERSDLSNMIKMHYQSIIQDKVLLDVSNSQYGPKSFEALLFRNNPTLYRGLQQMKADGDQLLILMRSIIRALESYANHPLPALEFEATGKDQYINILKEVITYFKSYMVEFTKSEFRYLMGGLFDHGGNSNMLLLFDEINHITLRILPRDALHLYDVSCAKARVIVKEDLSKMLYDEALFQIKTTYKKLKSSPYELWFDNGEWIDQQPFDDLTDDSVIIAKLTNDNSGTYKIIINKENVLN